MIHNSFQLLRTNTLLTSNFKICISSNDNIYFDSINTNSHLSLSKYKNYFINKDSKLEKKIVDFYDKITKEIVFDVKNDSDKNNMYKDYQNQFDNLYYAGASKIENKKYTEEFEYFAPLYIKKNNIPDGFIILKVEDSDIFNTNLNIHYIEDLNKDNFNSTIVDKWKCVKYTNLKKDSNIGYFLNENINNNLRFPEHSFYFNVNNTTFSQWYGLDYKKGIYTNKEMNITQLQLEYPHFKFEKIISEGFKNNELIYPYILNLNFLFDDKTANDYEFNRYYGFYVDKLEKVYEVSTSKQVKVKDNLKIKNNIFLDQYDQYVYPYKVNNIIIDKYIKINNIYYKVSRIKYDTDKYYYKIISDIIINEENTNNIIDNNMFSIVNNKINSDINFDIDYYFDNQQNKQIMYCSLYIIYINNEYHVLKYKYDNTTSSNYYYIQSDYNINSNEFKLTIDSNTGSTTYNILSDEFIKYDIFRIKFNEVKDFDFDKIETDFSDFDFEKSNYNNTIENKLNVTEYRDNSNPKQKKLINKELDGQYNKLNLSTEYVEELYELDSSKNITDIWNKNQSVCKWGYAGSNSHSNYPYKLNNSLKFSDKYNRTTNVNYAYASIIDKNLDYFYRIGNYYKYDVTFNYNKDLFSGDGSFTSNMNNWIYNGFVYTNTDNNFYLQSAFNTLDCSLTYTGFIENDLKDNDIFSLSFDLFNFELNQNGYVIMKYTDQTQSEPLLDYNFITTDLITIKKENIILKTNGLSNINFTLEFKNVKKVCIDNVKLYRKEKCKVNLNYFNQTVNIETELLKTPKFDIDYYFNNNFDYFDYFFKNDKYIENYGQKFLTKSDSYSVINKDNDNKFTTLFKGIKYNFKGISDIVLDENNNISKIIENYKDFSNYKFSFILSENYNNEVVKIDKDITSDIIGLGYIQMSGLTSSDFLKNDTGLTNIYFNYESNTSGYTSLIYYYQYIATGITIDDKYIYLSSINDIIIPNSSSEITYNLKLKLSAYLNYYDTYNIYLNNDILNPDMNSSDVIYINENYINDDVYNIPISSSGGTYNLIIKTKATNNSSYFMFNSLFNSMYLYDTGVYSSISSSAITLSNSIINTSLSNYSKILNIEKNGLHIICNETYKNILLILNVNIPTTTTFNGLEYSDNYEFNNLSSNFNEKSGLYYGKDNLNNNISMNSSNTYAPNEITAYKFINYINSLKKTTYFNDVNYYIISGDTYGYTTLNNFNSSTMTNVSKNKYPSFILKADVPNKINLYTDSFNYNPIYIDEYILQKYYKYYKNNVDHKSIINEPLSRSIVINKNLKNKDYIYRYNGDYDIIFKDIELFHNTYFWNYNYEIKCFYSNYKFNTNIYNFAKISNIIYSKINEEKNILKLDNEDKYNSVYPILDEFGYAITDRFIFKSTWDDSYYIKTLDETYIDNNYTINAGYIEPSIIHNVNVLIDDDNFINIKKYESLKLSTEFINYKIINRDNIEINNVTCKIIVKDYYNNSGITSKNCLYSSINSQTTTSISNTFTQTITYSDLLGMTYIAENMKNLYEYCKLLIRIEIYDENSILLDFDENILTIDNDNLIINFKEFFIDGLIDNACIVDNKYNFSIKTNIDDSLKISKYGQITMMITDKYNTFNILYSKNYNLTNKDTLIFFENIYLDSSLVDKAEPQNRIIRYEFKYFDFLNREKIIYHEEYPIYLKNVSIPPETTNILPYLVWGNTNFMLNYTSKANKDTLDLAVTLKNYSRVDFYNKINIKFILHNTLSVYEYYFSNLVFIKSNTIFTAKIDTIDIDINHGCFENNTYNVDVICLEHNSNNSGLTNSTLSKTFTGQRQLNVMSDNLLNVNTNNCLDVDSLILMNNFKYKKLKDIRVGDLLKSYNIEKTLNSEQEWLIWQSNNLNGNLVNTKVTEINFYKSNGYFIINDRIKVTAEHPILIYRNDIWEWCRVKDIIIGDMMYNMNNSKTPVISIDYCKDTIDVALINVENCDNYFANGILVHNTKN